MVYDSLDLLLIRIFFFLQIRYVVTDRAAYVLNSWSPLQQNLTHVIICQNKKILLFVRNNVSRYHQIYLKLI